MKVLVTKDYDSMSRYAFEAMSNAIAAKPDSVLGLATGSTPLGLYALLAAECLSGKLSFRSVTTLNLDEYVGLDGDNENSYRYFMNQRLFDRVDIDKNNTYVPSGLGDHLLACRDYDRLLDRYPRDIQLLGLGGNGHIAFNEPDTPFDSRTHIVNLTQKTITDNSRLFDDISQVPTQAISMGIRDILAARYLLVLASGRNKAEAVRDMLTHKVDAHIPCTVLNTHSQCVAVVDSEAMSLLNPDQLRGHDVITCK